MDVVNPSRNDEDPRSRQGSQSGQREWPFPLARITTCGGLKLEVLQRARQDGQKGENDPLEPVYGPPDATLLAKKGASTALLLLALLASQPGGFAPKDFLAEHLRHVPKHSHEEEEEREGLKRVDNVVCDLRHLLFPPRQSETAEDRLLRRRFIAYQRASQQSGPGYQLAGLPLIWMDVEAIEAHMKRARALEQFGEDGLAEWRAAYALASQGPFLPGECYSDWAVARREAIEAHLWDCVQVLWRRCAEQGEAGQGEAIGLLRRYWQGHKTCEDALRPLLELLGKRECFGEAETYYQQLCQELEEEGRQPDRRTCEVMDFLRALQIQRPPTIIQSREEIPTRQNAEHLPAAISKAEHASLPASTAMTGPPQGPAFLVPVRFPPLAGGFPLPHQGLALLNGTPAAWADPQAVGTWLASEAGHLGLMLDAGWSPESILATVQMVLQTVQAMPASVRQQLLSLGASAYLSGLPLPTGSHVTQEERVQLSNALGQRIGESWQRFQTTGSAQMLALGQSYLSFIQQTHALLEPSVRPYLYTGAYGIIGLALHFQGRHQEAILAHRSGHMMALATGDPWYVVQSCICLSDASYALGHYDPALEMIEEALRLLTNPLDEAQVRAKAHLLTCWADTAMTLGAYPLAEEKLEASLECLGQLGLDMEFDHAGWLLIAGKYALLRGKNELAQQHFQQALAELPEQWLLRRTMTALGLAMASTRMQERERSLNLAEQIVPMLQTVNAPMLNRWFVDYLQQDVGAHFSTDPHVQTFLTEIYRRLPHLVRHVRHTG